MAQAQTLICRSEDVEERGRGFRFEVPAPGGQAPAFVVRFEGAVHAYVNRCAHAWVELDWNHGEFFDFSGLYLVCATHGAIYRPESGLCVGGPCRGQRLAKLDVAERDGSIYLLNEKESGNG
ncbi:MAG TPA: Rieske 2Fe-2S domain-containing protein [Burkholderiales bacterium]|jgi:nitrite reductase/ring-hydroxylating ferredoxin subunit|nr:Rieske 2Fe-2S domain-containing protein [Burkholderiales bacterium]